ncbi:hypothetical protein [Frigoribacterium salinisoli]
MDLPSLAALGLDDDAAAVYRLLLADGDGTTVGTAATATGVDDPRAAASLATLTALGLAVRRSEGGEHDAVDPRIAVPAVLAARAGALAEVQAGLPALADAFRAARPSPEGGSATTVLRGAAAVGDHYGRLVLGAAEEFLAFDRPPYVVSAAGGERQRAALARGVRWRALYAATSFVADDRWSEVRRVGAEGEEARLVHALPVKLVVADRRAALVSLTLGDGEPEALVTGSEPLVAALVELFEQHWRAGVPVDGPTAAEPSGEAGARTGWAAAAAALEAERSAGRSAHDDDRPGAARVPTSFERGVLVLLAAGASDEAMALQLGVSTRTLRRRLRVLFDELGAANRFHAGVQAARRGWL